MMVVYYLSRLKLPALSRLLTFYVARAFKIKINADET
jgi:hypothetical protein